MLYVIVSILKFMSIYHLQNEMACGIIWLVNSNLCLRSGANESQIGVGRH